MQGKKEQFIINVVPLTKIPLTRGQSFYYLHDKKLPQGTLVDIPLFRRAVEGIVIDSKDDFERLGNIELKKINEVAEESFLSGEQIRLADFISTHYISPLGIVLKNFVPKRTKTRNKRQATSDKNLKSHDAEKNEIILTKEQLAAVAMILRGNLKLEIRNLKFLLFGPAGSGKTEVYIHAILRLREIDRNYQFLILVPEKTLTPQALERYGKYFRPEEIATLSSNLSKGKFYENWKRIKSGEAKVIIGTRMAVFASFKALGLVIVDEEQDMSYKQWDMNPRYDARTAAEKLAEIWRCAIVRGSATPSVESYYRTKNKDMSKLILPELKIPTISIRGSGTKQQSRSMTLVDMRKERWVKNYSCISRLLKSEIEYALKNKQQVVLLVNRQGMSTFSVCDKCKTVLSCPKCERALLYQNSGEYRCVHCAYKTSIFPECSACKGLVFKNIGIGTQKVEKEISNIFSSAKILRLDSGTLNTKDAQEEVYAKFSKGEADILIGTQMISKGWDLPRVSLVGIIDTDNLLTIPDYGTEEKAFQIIRQISGRVARPGAIFPGVAIIQTFHPESRFMKMIAQDSPDAFYEQEMRERSALKYPPFGKIVKLVYQDYNLKNVEKEVLRVSEQLAEIQKIRATEPQNSFAPKIRGRFRKQIIMKYADPMPTEAMRILKMLPNGWLIDVDPISIT